MRSPTSPHCVTILSSNPMNTRPRVLHYFINLIAQCLVLCLWLAPLTTLAQSKQTLTATLSINAAKVEGPISPALYGQFMEFMFQGIKEGLTAELIRNRSFEEAASVIGLSRYWERYPDDRNDDYALNFRWDETISYPARQKAANEPAEHSLRVDVDRGVVESHGIFQSRIPVREGVAYHDTTPQNQGGAAGVSTSKSGPNSGVAGISTSTPGTGAAALTGLALALIAGGATLVAWSRRRGRQS